MTCKTRVRYPAVRPPHNEFVHYAQGDPLIGGYAISTVNYSLSDSVYEARQAIYYADNTDQPVFAVCVADFVCEKDAQYVTDLHNANIREVVSTNKVNVHVEMTDGRTVVYEVRRETDTNESIA